MNTGTVYARMILAGLAVLLACAAPAAADSFFLYQGRLKVGGLVPDQSSFFDVQFRLFDVPTGGIQMTDVVTQVSVLDSNGLFRVLVDLGPNAFGREPRWLELGVRRAGTSNDFAVLLPRQRVGPVPTSLHAQSADVAASVTGVLSVANLPSDVARLDAPQVFTAAPVFDPAVGPPFAVGTTQQVANLNADLLDGLDSREFWRRRVDGLTETIGPTDASHTLNVVLGADRALRFQPGDAGLGSSMVGGSAGNSIATGVPGAVILGGRGNLIESNCSYSVLVGGDGNRIRPGASWSTIGGGTGNLIDSNSPFSGILGGFGQKVMANSRFAGALLGDGNTVRENSDFAATFAGEDNSVGPNSAYSVIASGRACRVEAGSGNSFIGSGVANVIQTNTSFAAILSGGYHSIGREALGSVVVGGSQNQIGASAYASFLGGGEGNRIEFNAHHAVNLGGQNNLVRTGAAYAITLGGANNVAGAAFSLAAGQQAKAEYSGSMVFADMSYADFASARANEFAVRARGGVRFETAGAGLTVDGMRLTSGGGSLLLPAGSVATSNLLDGAVIGQKIADGNVVRSLNGLKDNVMLSVGEGLALTQVANGLHLAASRSCADYAHCYWGLLGNGNVTAGVNFLGTVAGELDPLEVRVNNNRALCIVPAATPNLIGGFNGNSVLGGVSGAHIAGGGEPGSVNAVEANFGTIGGGSGHAVRTGATYATVGGGNKNTVWSGSAYATVSGGDNNAIQPEARYATIGGGQRNTIASSAVFATVSGGSMHTVGTNAVDGTIAGGSNNAIGRDALGATVSGGNLNAIQAGASSATIGGGLQNLVQASGNGGTIPGGRQGRVASYGQMAYASGAFVNPGDAQFSLYVLRGVTTSATPQELFLDGASQRLKVPIGGAWTFDILLVATLADELAVNGYQIRGVVKHTNAGVTSLVGAPVQTVLAAEAPAWVVTVEADDANDSLNIKVTGTTAKTIRWVANVRTAEVVF